MRSILRCSFSSLVFARLRGGSAPGGRGSVMTSLRLFGPEPTVVVIVIGDATGAGEGAKDSEDIEGEEAGDRGEDIIKILYRQTERM